jgi:hypothetical protein
MADVISVDECSFVCMQKCCRAVGAVTLGTVWRFVNHILGGFIGGIQ